MDKDKLSNHFSNELFLEITSCLLGDGITKDHRSISVNSSFRYIQEINNLGNYKDLNLQLFIVRHNSNNDSRVGLSKELFRILREYSLSNALIATYSDVDRWRYSLLTSSLEVSSSGKVLRSFSNPSRHSYVLGNNAKTLTPYLHLVQKGEVTSMEELRKRFSLEVVNKDFYNSVALLYTKLVGGKRKKGNSTVDFPGLLKIHGKASQSIEHQEFAVRLIGRLVFCWFLREKKSATGTSLIPDSVLSAQAAKNSMYYHKVLEPLFFELLNQKLISRKEPFKKEPFSLIPYLNGGLFSPQKGTNGDYYEYCEATEGGAHDVVDVPDSWLQEFTELLETYNFTVDENTSQDVELSVDPEMLGRIFENLLAEINPETGESARKSTGSFYTPREVVEYMVDRSLVYFLANKTNIDEPKLNALISYGLEDDELHPRTETDNKAIVDALSKLTILDPACGSGAYPIGILQKVVYILQQIDPDAKYWLEKQISSVSPELRRHLEKQYEAKNYDYLRKLGVIRESIFGVDIQAVATEIARLRCFLTLIVEESVDDNADNRGIEALPNLDFKFVTANSLLSLPEDRDNPSSEQIAWLEDTGHINELRRIRDNYFGANPEEKLSLQAQFNSLQTDMVIKNIDEYKGAASKRYNALSRWRPFEHKMVDWFDTEWMFGVKKFDIVIANPPYLAEKGHKDLFRKIKEDGLEEFYVGKMDLFYFFFHHAINLAASSGVVSFISTNYYPTAGGASKLRKDFMQRTSIKELINFNELKIFESALGQHNMVTILQKVHNDNTQVKTLITRNKGTASASLLNEILYGQDKNTDYYSLGLDEVYDNSYIRLQKNEVVSLLNRISREYEPTIGTYCNINQGLKTNADKVTKKHIEKNLTSIDDGTGIFVLKDEELRNLDLPSNETKYIFPFYKNSDIKKYWTNKEPYQHIIYIYNDNYPNDSDKIIASHLSRFDAILSSRAEVEPSGRIRQYAITRPRSIEMFRGEKVICPLWSKSNTFTYDDSDWFAATDVTYLTSKLNNHIPMKLLLAILNSKFVYVWLAYKGKRKGELLELPPQPISEIPIPEVINNSQQILSAVEEVLSLKQLDKDNDTSALESKIDHLVYGVYNLTKNEIELIEKNA